jgi:hypothetical protein
VGIQKVGAARVTTSHNNVFEYVNAYQGVTADAGALNANPNFVADFPAAPPVFRLDSGSPLIDQGNCELVPGLDFDGAPRPFDGDFDQSLGCDIGAYEFGPETVFVYVDGVPADQNSFATGREVVLTLMGRRDGFLFEVNPAEWTISPDVGVFHPETGRFRPGANPGFYPQSVSARFGGLVANLDVDLACGCIAPDEDD